MGKRYYFDEFTEWALYKGEEIIATGTAKEISKQLGIPVTSVLYYQTQSYLNRVENRTRNCGGSRILVPLDADEALSPDDDFRWCGRCKDYYLKNEDNFHRDDSSPDGFRGWCKDCVQAYGAIWRENKLKNTPEVTVFDPSIKKVCTTCKESLSATLDYFHRNRTASDGLCASCKICRGKYQRRRKEAMIASELD